MEEFVNAAFKALDKVIRSIQCIAVGFTNASKSAVYAIKCKLIYGTSSSQKAMDLYDEYLFALTEKHQYIINGHELDTLKTMDEEVWCLYSKWKLEDTLLRVRK